MAIIPRMKLTGCANKAFKEGTVNVSNWHLFYIHSLPDLLNGNMIPVLIFSLVWVLKSLKKICTWAQGVILVDKMYYSLLHPIFYQHVYNRNNVILLLLIKKMFLPAWKRLHLKLLE